MPRQLLWYRLTWNGRYEQYNYRVMAARALGRPLPKGVEVHHVDGDRQNNAPSNLVICQDNDYHNLLELRTRAFLGCGNPTYRYCWRCKQWGPVEEMTFRRRLGAQHWECIRAYDRQRYGPHRAGPYQKMMRQRRKAARMAVAS